ncbi:hypothetical protein [Pigmentiphaga sp. D-2]|uniref:Uncharacterized protein n=1 Tax=Pigmentiphaga daeguensis TaxID=414049 RepID=A0ABN1B6W7_9BURK|nr:hypothetical protein [Pigmentiphaga sp. D-2]
MILILCAAMAAPFGLIWLNARQIWTDLVVVYPPQAAICKGAPGSEWYDAVLSS